MTSTLGSCLRKMAEVSSGCLTKMAYSDPCLRLPALLWHGSVFGQRISRRPFNLQTKGFLPSYGKDRPFHSERLKRDLSSEFKVIAPNCLAMLYFLYSFSKFFKKLATLIYELKSIFSSFIYIF